MTQYVFEIKSEIKAVHIKSYGTLLLAGIEGNQIVSSSKGKDSLTVVEADGIIYVTAMNSCKVEVPKTLSVFVEKSMGSVHCNGMESEITGEKVLGNLVIKGAKKVEVDKIGGNCAVRDVSGEAIFEKVGGNFVTEHIGELRVEKVGGSCKIKHVSGASNVGKVGGSFYGRNLAGSLSVNKIGGDFNCDQCNFGLLLKVGGNIKTKLVGEIVPTEMKAGGDIKILVDPSLSDFNIELETEGDIKVKLGELVIDTSDTVVSKEIGSGGPLVRAVLGGNISLMDRDLDLDIEEKDFSAYFEKTEPGINEMIHEHVQHATEMAEKRIEAAQKRIEQMQKRVDIRIGDFDIEIPSIPPIPPIPPLSHLKSKGASDDERLLILQMLQEKKISVEEAEKLFRTLEK